MRTRRLFLEQWEAGICYSAHERFGRCEICDGKRLGQ